MTNGSIQPRGKGTYRLWVSAGADTDGARRRFSRTIHCRNITEAREALKRFVHEVDRRADAGGLDHPTFSAWAQRWLDASRRRLAPGTLRHYVQHLNDRIVPIIGDLQLGQITRRHILAVTRSAADTGRVAATRTGGTITETTLRRIHNTLSACLQAALEEGLIEVNPARQVKAPRPAPVEAQYYRPADVVRLLQVLRDDTSLTPAFRILIPVAIATGARRGELLALEWRHVDWETGRLTIEQSVNDAGAEVVIKGTKSGRARRIALAPSCRTMLRDWHSEQLRARNGAAPAGRDWVFTWPDGRPITPCYVSHRFLDLIAAHDLPRITFHGLRHTSATLLISDGVPMRAVSAVLGHAQASTTANIYAHVLEESLDQAAGAIEHHLAPSGTKSGTIPGKKPPIRG